MERCVTKLKALKTGLVRGNFTFVNNKIGKLVQKAELLRVVPKTIEIAYFPRRFGLDPKGLILLSGDLWM